MKNPEPLQRFLADVPQIVPEEYCFRCRICCRFPDTENVQTPFWSEAETQRAQAADPKLENRFIPLPGTVSRGVKLEQCGEGYRCPAFDPENRRCSIHSVKPLDCRLYPFVLTASSARPHPVLAMDMKCPYLQDHHRDPALADYARRLQGYLSSPEAAAYLHTNPKIVGPSWPEYVTVAELPAWVLPDHTERSTPPHLLLKPLTTQDRPMLEQLFRSKPRAFSGFSIAALLGWQDLIRFYRAEFDGSTALFAEQAGGWFMPLPPFSRSWEPAVIRKCWDLLRELNRDSGVSRVEGIEEPEAASWKEMGFRLRPSQSEYLYRRDRLADLRGDGYHSQRGAINRFQRETGFPCRVRSFAAEDQTACLQLYTRWAIAKQQQGEAYSRALVRDGLFFHRRLFMYSAEWGLTGWVLEAGGRLVGYTFGVPLSCEVFCLLAEIADPALPGGGAFLFREFCRNLEGYALINAMGDEGLEGLRRAKESYRPMGFALSYSADQAD
ncbi:MAG: DUF2156 domain-containing protein [Candidatus Omnitrophica bacterium]|nr:DUF2156 domain-containing protein [Candidatus Omnitrophota bacterium]